MPAPDSDRRPIFTALTLLGLEIALWGVLFLGAGLFQGGPNGKSLAVDFGVFISAAQALKEGKNPYDNSVLYRTQQAYFHRQHLPVTHNKPLVRAGNPPLFYWMLEPLTDRPFQPVAWGWLGFLTVVALLGFWASLAACGWRRRFVPVVIFLLLPPVLIGNAYGNVHALAFTALALVLLFIRRYPYLAGVCGTIGWLKPQLVFPLILLLALSQRRVAGRFVVGFAGATALLVVLTIAAAGARSFPWWMHGLTDWSNVIGLEPNIASLAGLYTGWASPGLRAMLQVLFLAFALALTAWWWWPRRQLAEIPIEDGAWLWGVWFLATPFAHYPDLVLLAIPVLASLGGDASRLTTRRAAALLYLPFVSLVILNVTMARVGVLPLAVVAMTLLLIQPGAWPFSAGEQVVTAPTESEGDRAAVPTSAGHPSQSC